MIGKPKGRAAYGTSDKNPGQEKETVLSVVDTQISSVVMYATTKIVANSSSCKGKCASYWRKTRWDQPHGIDEQVELVSSTDLWYEGL